MLCKISELSNMNEKLNSKQQQAVLKKTMHEAHCTQMDIQTP